MQITQMRMMVRIIFDWLEEGLLDIYTNRLGPETLTTGETTEYVGCDCSLGK